jgi:hypothetical protein
MEHIPYVYIIKNKTTGLKYIGMRYAKGCNPNDLLVTYFTSSKLVHKLLLLYGVNDFTKRILHQFPGDAKKAVDAEKSYFPLIRNRKDYLNICYSSGFLDEEIATKAGAVGGKIVFEKKIGIFRNYDERREWASMGGKIGGKIQYENKLGIHGLSKEEALKNASLGGKAAGMFQDKQFQSEMGKRGGVKNKGFRWYNDGVNSFKYTQKQQLLLAFDEFMSKNENFKKGRLR